MEVGQESSDSAVLRRRRRTARTTREKTPEPVVTARRKNSEELSESSSTFEPVQTVRMQIRPPGSMSAHESKILRRRDKTFASAANRSHSQPRQAERLSSPEAFELLRTVEKRSLSSPRHKEESSEGEPYLATAKTSHRYISPPKSASENLSRLEQNLRRFEEERRRFELEKRIFEKEKREHKLRYKQYMDNEERKRLVDKYRKLSDRIQLPTDSDERRRVVQSLRLTKNEAPVRIKPIKSSGYESSSPLSSSESEVIYPEKLRKHHSPLAVERHKHAEAHNTPVAPPPPVPVRRSASRNNSLSPIRPAQRSKTPDTGNESPRKSSIEDTPVQSLEREIGLNGTVEERSSQVVIENKSPKSSLNDMPNQNMEPKRNVEVNVEKVETMSFLRKRSLPTNIAIESPEMEKPLRKPRHQTIFSKFIALFKRSKTVPHDSPQPSEKLFTKIFVKESISELRSEWSRLKADHPEEIDAICVIRNKCFSHTIILALLCGFGGLIFRYTEGSFENIYKCEVRKVKRDFIDYLWTVSHNMREDDWKSAARMRLRKFEEELHAMQELGVRRFPGMKSWNFVNCVLYCWTVITTIGYGHITPQTTLGRSLTVVYSIIGIPMFLILLADFGKLFTRAIKFVWAYVRRIYYTGTCRKVRKQQQVMDVISGFNTMYDYAVRRPSQYIYGYPTDEETGQPGKLGPTPQTPLSHVPSHPETPSSPYPETFEIDDEFNLPISLASVILISYIVIGAFVYTLWEDWTYFEAFYFVFISMSTIGFGDFVPNHPIFMMCSIIYLVFGLALTSMFINVVQIKLSDTFKDASAKIGATIGLTMAEGSESHIPTPSDIASIHQPKLDPIGEDLNEDASPKGVQPSLPMNLEPQAPPLLPRKLSPVEPVLEKPKKKKGFFKK